MSSVCTPRTSNIRLYAISALDGCKDANITLSGAGVLRGDLTLSIAPVIRRGRGARRKSSNMKMKALSTSDAAAMTHSDTTGGAYNSLNRCR